MKTDEATGQQVCRRLVLAFHDDERKMPWVEVNAELLSQLKVHQVEGQSTWGHCRGTGVM